MTVLSEREIFLGQAFDNLIVFIANRHRQSDDLDINRERGRGRIALSRSRSWLGGRRRTAR